MQLQLQLQLTYSFLCAYEDAHNQIHLVRRVQLRTPANANILLCVGVVPSLQYFPNVPWLLSRAHVREVKWLRSCSS